MQIRHPEWRDSLENTKFPFTHTATLTNDAGDVIFETTFLDAVFYIIGATENIFLSKVVIDAETVTIHVGDNAVSSLASGSFPLAEPTDNLVLLDTVGRPAGLLVSEAIRLSVFSSWSVGEHAFTSAQTGFVARCCHPMPELGVRGFQLDDGNVVADDVWFVADDGVVLTCEDAEESGTCGEATRPVKTIRVDVVGDTLYRRRLCSQPESFQTPRFLETITFCAPGLVDSYSSSVYSSEYSSTASSIAYADSVDILFFGDTTGSMGGLIAQIKALFTPLAAGIEARFPHIDFKWAAASYKDLTDEQIYRTTGYRIDSQFTDTIATVNAGINTWSAGGGGDTPEAQFRGLIRLAAGDGTNPASWTLADASAPRGGLAGRAESLKIIVWTGDAEGHLGGGYLAVSAQDAGIRLASAGIKVLAINTLLPNTGLDRYAQASTIATLTGGGILHDVANLTTAEILDAIARLLGEIIEGQIGDNIHRRHVRHWDGSEATCVRCGPGEFGDVKISVHSIGAPDTILRIRPTPEGLKIEAVGERLEDIR
jgi:hypothetical protein